MIWAALIVPLITTFILWKFFREKVTWQEYSLLWGVVLIFIIPSHFIMIRSNTADIEYLGSYGTSVRHYDRWNEYIHRTCTRQVPCGRNSNGTTIYRNETYDCSYVQNHPEYWVVIDNMGHEYSVTQETYKTFSKRWGTSEQFIDMKRNFHTIDGDAQQYSWDRQWTTSFDITQSHSYENRILAARSLFSLNPVSKEEAKEQGLYDYPTIQEVDRKGIGFQSSIIGANPSVLIQKRFSYLNAYYGKKYQFRFYLLVFPGKEETVVSSQRDYWNNGNKNELVLCIGTDTLSGKIKWVNSFSWCDNPSMEVKLKSDILSSDSLNFVNIAVKTEELLLNGEWKRKNFSDFDYIHVGITPKQAIIAYFIVILLSIGLSIWIVKNQFTR